MALRFKPSTSTPEPRAPDHSLFSSSSISAYFRGMRWVTQSIWWQGKYLRILSVFCVAHFAWPCLSWTSRQHYRIHVIKRPTNALHILLPGKSTLHDCRGRFKSIKHILCWTCQHQNKIINRLCKIIVPSLTTFQPLALSRSPPWQSCGYLIALSGQIPFLSASLKGRHKGNKHNLCFSYAY